MLIQLEAVKRIRVREAADETICCRCDGGGDYQSTITERNSPRTERRRRCRERDEKFCGHRSVGIKGCVWYREESSSCILGITRK